MASHLADVAHLSRYWKGRQVGLLLQSDYQDTDTVLSAVSFVFTVEKGWWGPQP